MSYKVRGKIVKISDIQEFDSGSAKLTYRIDTGEEWNNILEFEMFKNAEYKEQLSKFIEYNNVGDKVEVEFKLKSNHWVKDDKDKVFIGLTSWRVEKLTETQLSQENTSVNNDEDNDLPF